jgi:type II secretory pathway component PulM
MTQSNAERQRQWRERQKQAGYRAMVVWLPPEAVDILTRYPERERGQVILNALRTAVLKGHPAGPSPHVTSNTPVTLPGNEEADTGPPAMLTRLEVLEGKIESLTQAVQGFVTGNTPVTLHSNSTHKVADTVTDTKAKVTDTTRKGRALTAEELARTAQSLHKQGLSYAQIAARWENEQVPTLKGGRWHKGTIGKLVQRYCVERPA